MTGAASNDVFATDLSTSMTGSTVDIRTTNTRNEYGERTHSGAAVTYPAHVQRVAVNPAGFDDDVTVQYVVSIPSTTIVVDTTAEVVLPAPISGAREIIKVAEHTDAIGRCGVTLYLGTRS
jgi:hypothetical protein